MHRGSWGSNPSSPRNPGAQEEAVAVLTFTTQEHLRDWLESDQRSDLLRGLEPIVDSPRTVNVVGGFAGWFGGEGGQPVKRWKQALVVLSALYPTALLLGVVREAVAPNLPSSVGTLVGNAAGVAILTWLLMPVLTRVLSGWLRS